MGLPLLVNWKSGNYDAILVVINRLTKIVYYKSAKTTIDITDLSEIIINVVVRHHGLPKSIISDWDSWFTSNF